MERMQKLILIRCIRMYRYINENRMDTLPDLRQENTGLIEGLIDKFEFVEVFYD